MKNIRTLFITPPYYSLRDLKPGHVYSLGVLYLSGYLREHGFDNKVIISDILTDIKPKIFMSMKSYSKNWKFYKENIQYERHPVWKRIEDIIREYQPHIVGISSNSPTIDSAYKVASVVKRVDSNISVLIGGFHGTFCPEEVLRNNDVDFVIRGEGEIPTLGFVQEIAKGTCQWEIIPSLSYKENNSIFRHNELCQKIPNLDLLPFPARDLIVFPGNYKIKEHAILATRGCAYQCAFCADRRFWGKIRQRSKENILKEIETILEGFPQTEKIYFSDGTLTFSKSFIKELCDEIIKRNIKMNFYCTARFDTIDEEMLSYLKEAGFQALYLGAESGDPEILQRMKKRITLDQIEKSIRLIKKARILTMVSIMLAVPGETEQSLKNTISMMKRIPADAFDINCYVPLPGSDWYDQYLENIRQNFNWLDIGYKGSHPIFFEIEGKSDLFKYIHKINKIADRRLRKTILRMILKKIIDLFS